MTNNYMPPPQFFPGSDAISIVNHPPEIHPGTPVKIVKPWFGNLCAVQLPNGMIHRWFAWFELKPEGPYTNIPLAPGSYARVINSTGHGNPPHVKVGTKVKIVKCIPTIFYDSMLSSGEYHRWLAEFELANPI
ncbi:hypothetical protein [Clostridium omnivorum]|uniref:Uncharacterized protein n=1 Tax=Clostridium omnivorum TaxID=1604902 RepID=A0ABQ5N308_9CLOT|nr:hypothetical protein [Clostridium sp. E14]GLC29594.1 hypothetical protein bsdE14_10040 [Clostridium sp. E14]